MNRRLVQLIIVFIFSIQAAYAAENWTEQEKNLLKSLSLSSLPPIPKSHSNRFADNAKLASLGKDLFFDKRFSRNGQFSCASCHQEKKLFTDGLSRAQGVSSGGRNTPSIIASAWSRWYYWDGRKDSLWSQALIPFEAHNEMASTRTTVVSIFLQDSDYRKLYERHVGRVPAILLDPKVQVDAGPFGTPEVQDRWYRMSKLLQNEINTVFVNIGKFIEVYERTLLPKATRFDQYVDSILTGEPSELLNENELKGLKLFIDANKTQCLQCHNGPLLTNHGFHNIGTANMSGQPLDFGRLIGLQAVLGDQFNCLGKYSDAKPEDCKQLRFLNRDHHIPLRGAFKTPSLRYLAKTSPYFHDGRFSSLTQIIQHYNKPPENNGGHELNALDLSKQEIFQLVSFLNALN